MSLLFANDRPGQYPPSWYAATATPPAPFPELKGSRQADVCIVGGGFTGLSAALRCAEAGLDVALVEAHRVGFGASGRNGGQLGSGQRVGQRKLADRHGPAAAQALWTLAEEAKAEVHSLCARHGIDADYRPGLVWAMSGRAGVADSHAEAAFWEREYGYDRAEALDRAGIAALIGSDSFQGGMIDRGAGHLHPLKLAFGLARAAAAAGARIFENSVVHHIQHGAEATIRCDKGQIRARHVILAMNGYHGHLDRKVAARVMPINNFIVATEPLGDRAADVLTRDVAVADDRFVVNYFRLSEDKRLLFGGGESYGYRFPRDIRAVVSKPLLQIYPHLRDVRLDYAWGGTLAITMKRLPYLARLEQNVLSASGYSGHGVGNAVQAGKLMAEAVRGQSAGFDAFAALPCPRFPGAPGFRTPLLALAMSWFALRDRLGI